MNATNPIHECGDCGELVDDLATHQCAPTVGPLRWSTEPDVALEQMVEALWDMCATVPVRVDPDHGRRLTWAELDPGMRSAARPALQSSIRYLAENVPPVNQDVPHTPEEPQP